jgi:hypothetical protein
MKQDRCDYCGEYFSPGDTIRAFLFFEKEEHGHRCGGTLDGRRNYCISCFMKLTNPHGPGKEHAAEDLRDELCYNS